MAGISNVTIEEFIEKDNDEFQRNFVGVFHLIEQHIF